MSWPKRKAFELLRAALIISRGFVDDLLLLRASALTYSTLLALVPFFALSFAALKKFGVQDQVEPWVLNQVTAGARDTIFNIIDYVNRTDMKALGVIGVILLLFTAISVIVNVERSLNTIWGVKVGRSWFRRITDYLGIVIIGPILLFIVLTVTTTVQGYTEGWLGKAETIPIIGWFIDTFVRPLPSLASLLPYVLVCVFFTFLYLYLPNTKVRFKSALLAGLIAGILWQMMQWGYVRFQVGVAQYNAVYGTLAQLPVLLAWIYLSWVVFLLGAEIAFAHQHLRTYDRERESSQYSPGDHEAIAIRMMMEIARHFIDGKKSWTSEQLCEKLNVPLRLVNDTLFQLKEGKLLVSASEGQECLWMLAHDLDNIRLYDIVRTIRYFPKSDEQPRDVYVQQLVQKIEKSERDSLEGLTLREALAEEMEQK